MGSREVQGSLRNSGVSPWFLIRMISCRKGGVYGVSSHFPGAVPSFVTTAFGCVSMTLCWRWLPSGLGKTPSAQRTEQNQVEVPSRVQSVCVWPIHLVIVLRVLQGFNCWALADLVPLWAISSEEMGGLALSQVELGYMLSISGLGAFAFLWHIFPRRKKFGLRKIAFLAAGVGGVACAAFPFSQCTSFAVVLLAVAECARMVVNTACSAMTVNVAPTGHKATVNGITVMAEGVGKGLAPVVAASSFAWSLSSWGPAGRCVAFFALAVLNAAFAAGVLRLPDQVEGQRSAATSALPLRSERDGQSLEAAEHTKQ